MPAATAGGSLLVFRQLLTMLRSLSIRDFTIIDQLELEFRPGFTAITGETGAGKSILVEALVLLLGARAGPGLVAPGREQAELAATFELADEAPARAWLEEQSLAADEDLLLRRVLPVEGPSRSWINGRPATVGQLRELGMLMVDIHGQHEHQRLARPAAQRCWLDRHVPGDALRAVAVAAQHWNDVRASLTELEARTGDENRLEMIRYQLRELEELALEEGEFAGLEAEQSRLSRLDELLEAMHTASAALDGEDPPGARALLQHAVSALERLDDIDPGLKAAAELLTEARINADEVIADLKRHAGELEGDPERLAAVEQRLGRSLELARKHRIEPEALPSFTLRMRETCEELAEAGERRARLEQEIEQAEAAWRQAADELSSARRDAAGRLAGQISEYLARLGMNDAEVIIEVSARKEPGVHESGRDRVEIRFSANPGQPPQPLGRVASGGELSRFSLALIIASRDDTAPRVRVFDEVDAGVGGETAHAVGRFMRQAAGSGQAFCVTHLAQVAARADHQVRVTKESRDGRTQTAATSLDAEARQHEIARMLGSSRSDRGMAHAAELLAEEQGLGSRG